LAGQLVANQELGTQAASDPQNLKIPVVQAFQPVLNACMCGWLPPGNSPCKPREGPPFPAPHAQTWEKLTFLPYLCYFASGEKNWL
jgi:hypothetical protein